MAFPDIFTKEVTDSVIQRINLLTPEKQPQWGKMNASQMLAHCSVAYEMIYENKHPKPSFVMKFVLRKFVKKSVTNDVPYARNLRTAPQFLVSNIKDFAKEKIRLIQYLQQTQQLGGAHFHNLESHSFGPLTQEEWNNMLYKHLDHHLRQFGV